MTRINTDASSLLSLSENLDSLIDNYQENINTIFAIIRSLSTDSAWVGLDANNYIQRKMTQKQDFDNLGNTLRSFSTSIDFSGRDLNTSINSVRRN